MANTPKGEAGLTPYLWIVALLLQEAFVILQSIFKQLAANLHHMRYVTELLSYLREPGVDRFLGFEKVVFGTLSLLFGLLRVDFG